MPQILGEWRGSYARGQDQPGPSALLPRRRARQSGVDRIDPGKQTIL